MRLLLQARAGSLPVALVLIWATLVLVFSVPAVAQDTADAAATRQYSAAVALQNRGVFDLAAEEWTKFLTSFKSDSRADRATKTWMGLALFPQAGVPIGMTLVAADRLPEYRQIMLSIVISTTVFFEIIGPVFTRLAIRRVISDSSDKSVLISSS